LRANCIRANPSTGRPIKNLPDTITVSSDASTSEIFEEIAKASRFSIHRLRVTKGSDGSPINNVGDVTVHDTGLRNKSAVDVKDLGTLYLHPPQKHN
jgi:very-long-chain enoyl-CoA reductase